ncbi:MAG TPA: ISAs1 family transposase [Candidatus Saccharimonadales bacterium]|nr:ISAs1 family transposase [Candidatus Saccharimonadales bacterium]
MAQREVGNKENEITKVPEVIKLAKIAGKVVIGDALYMQKRLAQTILDEQGDYIFQVKENQPNLYKTSNLYSPRIPQARLRQNSNRFSHGTKSEQGTHLHLRRQCRCGRIEIRTITTNEMLNAYAAWPGLAQVYRLEREFQWRRQGVCYKTSHEVEFGITSLAREKAGPRQLLEIRRTHLGIQTGSHYTAGVAGM